MTSRRMTKLSKENIQAADRAQILVCDSGGYFLKVWAEQRVAFVHGADGFIMVYPSVSAAERALNRIRPDLRPTIEGLS
jgi:hypothetical protein